MKTTKTTRSEAPVASAETDRHIKIRAVAVTLANCFLEAQAAWAHLDTLEQAAFNRQFGAVHEAAYGKFFPMDFAVIENGLCALGGKL